MKHQIPKRAFVIPVLDYSPASEYSILTLLEDLKNIDGEVIVIFNGAKVGEDLKNHPRVTRHAIMKQNVGVSRAWNIGIHMSEAETVHIVNADAHITLAAVDILEQGLSNLENAVCVGPQGSFVNFAACEDYLYFDKGSFSKPIQVDAVSGFFFAVNRRLMARHGLAFENDYTPCYFEEWDLGLQARQAGLACWIVPTTAYDHHWSGTIRALRTIPFMGREETAGEVLERNKHLFRKKWQLSSQIQSNKGLSDYLRQTMLDDDEQGDFSKVVSYLEMLEKTCPDDEAKAFSRYMRMLLAKRNHANLEETC